MGDVSIIARRLADGHVQYGWSGNGGYFKSVGARLLLWYQDQENVEYLFGLGQTSLIGAPGSEHGGFPFMQTHSLMGKGFWLDYTEQSIFSKIAFIDYAYFFDVDYKWYYIIPGPFSIKIPLTLIAQNLDEQGYEFEYLRSVQNDVLVYIFGEYRENDTEFAGFLDQEGYSIEDVKKNIRENGVLSVGKFYRQYKKIYDYFDNWILIKTNAERTDIIVKKKTEEHLETCEW